MTHSPTRALHQTRGSQHRYEFAARSSRTRSGELRLLLSGWHLGAILLFLRTLPSVEQIAGFLAVQVEETWHQSDINPTNSSYK